MANFCSGVKVRLFGGAAGSMSSSVTSSFYKRQIKGVELVKVMVSVLPVSPWREERLRQVSHVSLTDRGPTAAVPFAAAHSNALAWCTPRAGVWRYPTWSQPSTSQG